MNETGTAPALPLASTGWSGSMPTERDKIMSRLNFDAVRSLAIAGVVSLYSSMMLLAAMGANGAEIGRLVI
jgi:hypothetical protein